ncbi:Kielin/chordin protein [Apis cerana cerana]|uniref:Kielin/chordin protein n=1 Tax=Apis cerana cerana TaxID=94128 RepID=A0A2A3EL63_APICC|nr:Kielin/chordin protein [Apis cerana cerana]
MRRLSSKPLILVLALALISSIRHCHASESIIEDNTPMTLDNRYGMRVTEESAPGSDIGRPRDQSYRIIIVIATSVLPGSRETCDVEGEDFTVDKIPNTRCFNCLCKNGFVECRKQQCPSIEGCYTLLEPREDECCHRCKGCTRNGVHHGSETEWIEGNDPCRIFACKAGVITESRLHCYTPCSDPIPPPPGQCCPVCTAQHSTAQHSTAQHNTTQHNTTQHNTTQHNNTTQHSTAQHSTAQHNTAQHNTTQHNTTQHNTTHETRARSHTHTYTYDTILRYIEMDACKGYGDFVGCHVNGQMVTADRSVTTTEDPCVTCRCNGARLTCAKQACPVLHCLGSRIVHDPGECCPRCKGSGRYLSPPKGACTLGTSVYNSGNQFYLDQCTRCTCSNSTVSCVRETCPVHDCPAEHQIALPGRKTYGASKVRCAMPMCPPLNLPCPPNSRLEHPEGQCCPRCVESDGVCTVFGDPHYRTFDGKFYSFKGACKYQLASDCIGHTFSIRVTNDARSTRFSAWTKTIAIKVGDSKVNLGQKMRVKVNGKKVEIPYRVVLWDGISFLEVSAPTSYRGHLCGLCGNFNSLPKDDFTNRRGKLLQDPQPRCRGRKDHRLCTRLRSQIFDACHKKVNPNMYYKACLQDMCECPTENCYCESFTAYVHECKRLGIQLPHWRKSTRCRTGWDQFSGSGASLGLRFP